MGADSFFQTALAVWSVFVGMALCAVYDIFRVFRLRREQNRILLFLCDFLFCIIAAVFYLVLFFNLSYGKARAYAFLFGLIGFLIWRFSLSRIYMAVILKIITVAEKILSLIKMRISAVCLKLMRRIYTKKYCRSLVKQAKNGRIFKKRKEIKNEQETYPS